MASMRTTNNTVMTEDIRQMLLYMDIIEQNTLLISGDWFTNSAFYNNPEVTAYMIGVHNLINNNRIIFYYCTTHAKNGQLDMVGTGNFIVRRSGTNCGVVFKGDFDSNYVGGTISYQQGQSRIYEGKYTDNNYFMNTYTGYANYPIGSNTITDGIPVMGGLFTSLFTYGMTTEERQDPSNYELFWIFNADGEPVPQPTDPSAYTTLELWKGFRKRPNSTKRPSMQGVRLNVLLKDKTSVLEPHFILLSQEFDYNYCKWGNRYYYIEDTINQNNSHIELVCSVDPLASWKSDILNTTAYIERSGAMGQSNIFDPMFPPTIDYKVKHTDLFNWKNILHPQPGHPQEYYILGVVTSASTEGGTDANGVTYYGIAESTLEGIMKQIGDKDFGAHWKNQMKGLRDCLLSLKHVPFVPQGTTKDIYIGGVNISQEIGEAGVMLDTTPIQFGTTGTNGFVDITTAFPSRDPNMTGGIIEAYSYLDLPPYSAGMLYLPWVGLVDLDLKMFGPLASRKIKIEGFIDQLTADVIYRISSTTDTQAIATYQGNCGSDLPIASQHYNPIGVIQGAVQTVGGVAGALMSVPGMNVENPIIQRQTMQRLAAGQTFAYGATQAAMGITNMISSFALKTQTNGALSSYLGSMIDDNVWIEIYTHVPPSWELDSVKQTHGLPFNREGRIGDQLFFQQSTGYAKTTNCSVHTAATREEKQLINQYCNSGIFIE